MAGTSAVRTERDPRRRSQYGRGEYCVVRERPDKEEVECQLEAALEKGFKVIIVEPLWLGDQTLRWIRFGNFLHKTSVLASLGALVCLPVVPQRVLSFTVVPLGVLGSCCAALYDVSWQFDPCCKYQVDHGGKELSHVPSHELHSQSPVVLVLRNDKYRKRLHNSLALAVMAVLGWKLYRSFYS